MQVHVFMQTTVTVLLGVHVQCLGYGCHVGKGAPGFQKKTQGRFSHFCLLRLDKLTSQCQAYRIWQFWQSKCGHLRKWWFI